MLTEVHFYKNKENAQTKQFGHLWVQVMRATVPLTDGELEPATSCHHHQRKLLSFRYEGTGS